MIKRLNIDRRFLLLLVSVTAVFLIASCYYYKKTVQDGHSISYVDFRVYYYAGMGLEADQDIYSAADPEFIYKYSPIFALAVSTIKFLTRTPADALLIWYLILYVCLALSLYIIKKMLSEEVPGLTLGILRIIPFLFIFRYLILVNFIMYLPTEWPSFVKIFDRCLYVVGAVYMLSLLFPPLSARQKDFFIALVVSLLLNLRFIILNIDRAQANIIVLAAILLFAYYLVNKKDATAGVYLGIAMVVKLVPAIFLLYLVLKRRLKAFFSCVITFVSLLIIPSIKWGVARNNELLIGWLNSLRVTFHEEYLNYKNQSLFAMISRFLSKDSPMAVTRLSQSYVTAIIIGAYIVVVGILIYAASRNERKGGGNIICDICLFMTAMTFLSPVGTMHTFVFMLLPIALMVNYALERRLKDILLNTGILIYGLAVFLNSYDIIGKLSVVLNEHSLMTFVLLWVFFVFLYTKKRPIEFVTSP